ncbi:MAG: transglycosylase SLT domain-containing protein [Chitinispirillales bacterium]|jgi:soluble lytic murein transglycosylase-like protein|nr:transglycosylase SLT domain-containing protein [Chitinispirillales bacterium]
MLINHPQKSSYLRAALIVCALCRLLPAAIYPQAAPQLPSAISWAGTRELAAGDAGAALLAVRADSRGADSLLWLYKYGVINARLGNTAEAAQALNTVSRVCRILTPLAMERLGDIAAGENDFSRAMASYGSALGAAGLPPRYRHHLFIKVSSLIGNNGIALPRSASWADEYHQWERRQRMLTAAGFEAVCDSLIAAGGVAEVDSLLGEYLPGLAVRDACGIVERLFQKGSGDTTEAGTKFLFTLASQAAGCRNFVLAERILTQARRRADFSTIIPAKQSDLLTAQIAFGREQWQQAANLYIRYDSVHTGDAEVLMRITRAFRSLGNTAQMQRWQDAHINRFPAHQQAQEILWLRAWNHEMTRNFRPAIAGYRQLFETAGRRSEEARVRHAFCFYKLGQYDSVIVHIDAFRQALPNSNQIWAGLFWQGKAHAARGRTEEAHKVWNQIVRLNPADYHAHRAMQLMGLADSVTGKYRSAPPGAPPMSEGMARAWLDSISPASPRRDITREDSIALRRGAALLSVARTDEAALFLDDYLENFPGNLLLQYDLACAYAIAGSIGRAFRPAQRLTWRIPPEHREHIPLQVLTVMYPPFYAPAIIKYARRFNVDPLFVSALMRQESIFDSSLVSSAGAIGLMQIMPATGRKIATELQERNFATDSLYNTDLSIRFGVHYMRKRLTQFNGNLVLTLCAYNAGANNAIRWRDRSRGVKHDIFVEDVGFLETRIYVKRVLGNYWTYQRLVATPGYEYPL